MDTGNNLCDPFSGYPVIMVDKTIFSQLFNEEKGVFELRGYES